MIACISARAAQDRRVSRDKYHSGLPKGYEPAQDGWPSAKWLSWFLRNHGQEQLIAAGVWKAVRFIVADHGDDEEGVAAMRAAYKMGGEDAAYSVLVGLMLGKLPEGTPLPELPEEWNDRVRFWGEELQDPARAPLFGRFLRDNGGKRR